MTIYDIYSKLTLAKVRKGDAFIMTQVNMLEAKSNLSKLVKILEHHEEDVVYIARDGKPVVMMVRIPNKEITSRFGIAEGVFTIPKEFDNWDNEIAEMFEETI